MNSEDLNKLTIAPIGAAYMILATSNSSKFGVVKELWSARKAAAHKSEGPAKELINTLINQSKDKEVSEKLQKSIGSKWNREHFGEVGSEWLHEAVPIIQKLPDNQAEHIRNWIIETGQKTAEAAKDKESGEKVSQAEKSTLERIAEILNQ